MKLKMNANTLTVTREHNDPKFHGVVNAAGESRLFHHIKNLLNDLGADCIKKRMWKDGHMVSEMQQYIRDRKYRWCIRNAGWHIEGAEVDFNMGKVNLQCHALEDGGIEILREIIEKRA